jgi:hypothetical protein
MQETRQVFAVTSANYHIRFLFAIGIAVKAIFSTALLTFGLPFKPDKIRYPV